MVIGMKEAIISIIDKLNIKVLMATFWVLAIFSVFAPENFLKSLGLIPLKEKYKWAISLVFLILTAYYMVTISILIYSNIISIIQSKKLKRFYSESLRSLSKKEQLILLTFYNRKEKQFDLESKLDIKNATVSILCKKLIIGRGSQIGNLYDGFSYFLQPGAISELNNMLLKGEIKINQNDFEWKSYNSFKMTGTQK